MIKFLTLYIVCIFLFIPVALGVGTIRYPNPSGVDYDWSNEGRGEFVRLQNEGYAFIPRGEGLNNPLNMPIIDDLDNNSVNEIIIVDGDNVKVFQNKELDLIDGVDIGDIPSDISNILSFDIDGDSLKEIIFLAHNINSSQDRLMILNWTETDGIQKQHSFEVTSGGLYMPPMIACRKPNECILINYGGFVRDLFNPFTHYLRGQPFDSTGATGSTFVIYSEAQASSNGLLICTPRTKNIVVKDYDNKDNDEEYIFSFADKDEFDEYATYHMVWLDNTTIDGITSDTSTNIPELIDNDCTSENGLSNFLTSPIVAELYSNYNNDESAMAVQYADDDFQIWIYSGEDWDRKDIKPKVLGLPVSADGVIISNIVLGNFFPDTPRRDFCVFGYVGYDDEILGDIQDEIELLCANRETDTENIFGGLEYSTAGLFNISSDVKNMYVAIHGVQHSNALQDGKDLDEILTAYGIFSLDYVGIDEINLDWENPSGEGVILSIDLENIGFDDIIVMTDTNLLYYDDGISNEPAIIESVFYNPCPFNMIFKVNTTMDFAVDIRDLRGDAGGYDDVNMNIFIYYETPNEQNDTYRNVSVSQTDGRTTIYSNMFQINKTGLDNKILIEVWDTENPTEIATIDDVTFDVGLAGIEYGDVTCRQDIAPPDECITDDDCDEGYICVDERCVYSGVCSTDEDCPDGYVCIDDECIDRGDTLPVRAMQEASGIFGISVTVLWLMFMLSLAIGFWFAPIGRGTDLMDSVNGRLIIILIGEIFMLILGTMLGFLPLAIMISIIILSLIVMSVWTVKKFTGASA